MTLPTPRSLPRHGRVSTRNEHALCSLRAGIFIRGTMAEINRGRLGRRSHDCCRCFCMQGPTAIVGCMFSAPRDAARAANIGLN
ncbi:hypothetical protein BJX70DRAFT_374371 [Aspergillus crustosus]